MYSSTLLIERVREKQRYARCAMYPPGGDKSKYTSICHWLQDASERSLLLVAFTLKQAE